MRVSSELLHFSFIRARLSRARSLVRVASCLHRPCAAAASPAAVAAAPSARTPGLVPLLLCARLLQPTPGVLLCPSHLCSSRASLLCLPLAPASAWALLAPRATRASAAYCSASTRSRAPPGPPAERLRASPRAYGRPACARPRAVHAARRSPALACAWAQPSHAVARCSRPPSACAAQRPS
jgi:hypothetical protein